MINIVLCDDNKSYLSNLKEIVMECLRDQNINGKVDTYLSGTELLDSGCLYDVYILDIEMPMISGIEVGKRIKRRQPSAIIIFLTVTKQYALEGYEAEPLRYLLKENSKEKQKCQVKHILQLAIQRLKKEEKSIILEKNRALHNLKISQIVFAEVYGHSCIIHMEDGMRLEAYCSLKELEQKLGDDRFIRCHKSYLVNIQFIKNIKKNHITMEDGQEVYLSRSRIKLVKKAIVDYWE